MKKRNVIVLLLCLLGMGANAQKVLVNSVTEEPIAGALVLNEDGRLLGVTKADGALSDEMTAAGKIDVVHFAYAPVEFQLDGTGAERLAMTPSVNHITVTGTDKRGAKYVWLRGWQRNYQFENKRLTFITEGIVEYLISLDGKKMKGYRTEGMQGLMAKGMSPDYDVTRIQLSSYRPFIVKNKRVVTQNGNAGTWQLMKDGKPFGTQCDRIAENYCMVEIPDMIVDDSYKFNFLGAKFKFEYISIGQILTPYRADAKYTMADLSVSHAFYSVDTRSSKKDTHYDYVEDFYAVEAELLTEREAMAALKRGDSPESVSLPANVPALSKALEKAKAGFVVSE